MEVVVEEWRRVAGFDGYEVSSEGRVRSFFQQVGWGKWKISDSPQRELSLSEDDKGYLRVGLRKGGRTYAFEVHRLVAGAFMGLCPEGYEVCHRDHDKQNNSVDNLYYATHEENARSGHGDTSIRMTREDVVLLRSLAADGWSDQELVNKFEVSEQVVSLCRLGHTYKWAGGPITKRRPGRSGGKAPPTDEEVRKMRVLAHDGVKPLSDIANRYGVSLSYLSKVIRGKFRKAAGGPTSDPRSKHFEERMKI